MATRVARVTPLLMTSSPSEPRLTSTGGIPYTDVPNVAIWRCSFQGSAPDCRECGRRNVRGSTSRNTRGFIIP